MLLGIAYFYSKTGNAINDYYCVYTNRTDLKSKYYQIKKTLEKRGSDVSLCYIKTDITVGTQITLHGKRLFLMFEDYDLIEYEEKRRDSEIVYDYLMIDIDDFVYGDKIKYFEIVTGKFFCAQEFSNYVEREIFDFVFLGLSNADNLVNYKCYDCIMESERSAGCVYANNINDAREKACRKIVSNSEYSSDKPGHKIEYILAYSDGSSYRVINCEAVIKKNGKHDTNFITIHDVIREILKRNKTL